MLLLLGKDGLFLVEYALFIAIFVLNGIVYAHVAQVERLFNDLIGAAASSSVGRIDIRAIAVQALVGNIPCAADRGVFSLDLPLHIGGRVQKRMDKVRDVLGRQPCRAQPHVDLMRAKVLGLHGPQCLHIGLVAVAEHFQRRFRLPQLLPHIAGKILVCAKPLFIRARVSLRVLKDHPLQAGNERVETKACQFAHEAKVYAGALGHAHRKGFRRALHMFHWAAHGNRPPGEHVGLALKVALVIEDFQGRKQIIAVVLAKYGGVAAAGE